MPQFKTPGTISRINYMTDRETGAFKGMAFVDYESTDAVDGAVKKMCNTMNQ